MTNVIEFINANSAFIIMGLTAIMIFIIYNSYNYYDFFKKN